MRRSIDSRTISATRATDRKPAAGRRRAGRLDDVHEQAVVRSGRRLAHAGIDWYGGWRVFGRGLRVLGGSRCQPTGAQRDQERDREKRKDPWVDVAIMPHDAIPMRDVARPLGERDDGKRTGQSLAEGHRIRHPAGRESSGAGRLNPPQLKGIRRWSQDGSASGSVRRPSRSATSRPRIDKFPWYVASSLVNDRGPGRRPDGQ